MPPVLDRPPVEVRELRQTPAVRDVQRAFLRVYFSLPPYEREKALQFRAAYTAVASRTALAAR